MRHTLSLFLIVAFLFSLSSIACAQDWRAEVGVGLNYGQAGADSEDIGGVDVDGSVGTGNGFMGGLTLWKDKVWADWFSLGAGYTYRSNTMDCDTFSNGRSRKADTELTMNDFQIKAAARKSDGDIHPYIGVGLGLSYLHASLETDTLKKTDGETFAPTVSAFVGYDYDINETYYTGIDVNYTYSTGEVVDVDIYHNSLGAMLKLGVKF